jgi:hypothetical protein
VAHLLVGPGNNNGSMAFSSFHSIEKLQVISGELTAACHGAARRARVRVTAGQTAGAAAWRPSGQRVQWRFVKPRRAIHPLNALATK